MNQKKSIHSHNVIGTGQININEVELNKFIDQNLKNAKKILDNIPINNMIKKYEIELSNSNTLINSIIDLRNIDFKNKHLDVGGSGEKIIYKASYPKDIIIIDLDFDSEIINKRVKCYNMDACSMEFENNYFKTITIFYTIMYMKEKNIIDAFIECYRVLDIDGLLYIWDICIDFQANYSLILAPVIIKYNNVIKKVTYGTKEVSGIRNQNYYTKMLIEIGFIIKECVVNNNSIFIVATK